MKENRLFTLVSFILFTLSATAQIKGVVRDSITKEPIAYAAIVYEKMLIGTNTNEKGEFELSKNDANVIISCLGYTSKNLKLTNINEVLLSPITQEIEEVVVRNKKNSSQIIVGEYHNSEISFSNGGASQIWAKHLNYPEEIKKHPFVKTIQFTTTSDVKAAKLKLRFLSTNSEGKPLDDIIFDEIIVTVKKGKHKNKVNLENYNITIPKEGIFIGFENLIIEENKYEYTYTIEGSKIKMKGISYEPSIKGYEAKEYNVWSINNRRSILFNAKHKKNSKPVELGVQLTLTN
jgi:hypothetical protein